MMEIVKQWIEKLQVIAKDPAKLSMALVSIFLLGILLSAYRLASLPSDLIYQGGMTSSGSEAWVLAKLFTTIGITLIIGVAVIYFQYKVKKEVFVFVEKQQTSTTTEQNEASAEDANFDLKNFQDSITKSKDLGEKKQNGLNLICKYLEAGQGALYSWNGSEAKFTNGFAFAPETEVPAYTSGEGLVGQAATGKSIYLDELPEDYVQTIESGLGMAKPRILFVMPLRKNNQVTGIIEVAAFKPLSESVRKKAMEAGNILADNC